MCASTGCQAAASSPEGSPATTPDGAVTIATLGLDAGTVASSTVPVADPSTHPATESASDVTANDTSVTRSDADRSHTSDETSGPAETSTAHGGASDGGADSTAASGSSDCEFVVSTNEVSAKMPTVGVVEWSLAGAPPSSAKIVFELVGAPPTLLNVGGAAPVNLSKPNYRTLLLGLKQNSDYTFRIEAVRGEQTCVSDVFALPKTGKPEGAPTERTVVVEQAEARTPGFILTPGGYGGYGAYIIDADGAVVWYVRGPADPGRMHMDYEGENMWIMSLNPILGASGQLQVFSMDGLTAEEDVEGFDYAHHDFVVMPGGKLATMIWKPDFESVPPGEFIIDPPSDLVIRSAEGTLTTAFAIGSNLYASDLFHCNALHYIPEDDSFTISDRNQSLVVKVSAAGQVQWQLGGSCTDAPSGAAKCLEGTWNANHGHHLLPDGTFLLFNNYSEEDTGKSSILEFDVTATADALTVVPVKSYLGTQSSTILGDVQRLPNGHTLITYSSDGRIVEVDAEWNVVQTIAGNFGYAEWRPSLYGPPVRL